MAARLVEIAIAWKKPELDWMKVNVDGSYSAVDGSASCGGVLRDNTGSWRRGFMCNLGICSIGEAEAWGVLHGLHLAARIGVHYLIVECDSKTTVDLLRRKESRRQGTYHNLIQRCLEMGKAFRKVEFCHVYREQNRIVDTLAKQALTKHNALIEMGILLRS